MKKPEVGWRKPGVVSSDGAELRKPTGLHPARNMSASASLKRAREEDDVEAEVDDVEHDDAGHHEGRCETCGSKPRAPKDATAPKKPRTVKPATDKSALTLVASIPLKDVMKMATDTKSFTVVDKDEAVKLFNQSTILHSSELKVVSTKDGVFVPIQSPATVVLRGLNVDVNLNVNVFVPLNPQDGDVAAREELIKQLTTAAAGPANAEDEPASADAACAETQAP